MDESTRENIRQALEKAKEITFKIESQIEEDERIDEDTWRKLDKKFLDLFLMHKDIENSID